MKQKNKEQNHNKKYIAIEILVGILVSLGIFLFLYLRGYQPAGEDVYGHLYKVECKVKTEVQNGCGVFFVSDGAFVHIVDYAIPILVDVLDITRA